MTTTVPSTDSTNATDAPELMPITELIDQALDRLSTERARAAKLLTNGPKCRRMSALHEQEARLWHLLAQRTDTRVYWRAAFAAELAARDHARTYADLAQRWTELDRSANRPATTPPGGES